MAKKILVAAEILERRHRAHTNLVSNQSYTIPTTVTDGAVRRFMRKVGMEKLDDLFLVRSPTRGQRHGGGLPAPIGGS
jgi:hypothetical protein